MSVAGYDLPAGAVIGISDTASGLFASCFVGTIILGISIVQTWSYFRRTRDGWTLQLFVTALVLLDMVESSCTIGGLYGYLISHFGDFKYLRTFDPAVTIGYACSFVIIFLTHLFFAKRIYQVYRKKWLLVLNLSVAITGFAFAVVSCLTPWIPSLVSDNSEPSFAIIGIHVCAMTSDVIITVALTRSLASIQFSAKKFRAGSTSDLLHRILVYTVTRGIVITVAQGIHITMFIAKPKDFMFWTSTHFIITKLYVLTTIVTLNSRRNSEIAQEVRVFAAAMEETVSLRFANRDSIDEDENETEKARAIQSAPAFV